MFTHKLFNLPSNRLALQLAQETLKCNKIWAKEWRKLEETYEITLNTNTIKKYSFNETEH